MLNANVVEAMRVAGFSYNTFKMASPLLFLIFILPILSWGLGIYFSYCTIKSRNNYDEKSFGNQGMSRYLEIVLENKRRFFKRSFWLMAFGLFIICLILIPTLYYQYIGISETMTNKGMDLAAQGRNEEAISAFDEAISVNQKFVPAYYYKGITLLKMKKFNEALQTFDKAIYLEPKYASAWYQKGVALLNLAKNDEAVQALNNSTNLNPIYAPAWFSKGNAFYRLGKYNEAINAYNRTIRLAPRDANTWYNINLAYSKLGKQNESHLAYNTAHNLTVFGTRDLVDPWGNRIFLSTIADLSGEVLETDKVIGTEFDLNAIDLSELSLSSTVPTVATSTKNVRV